MTHLQIEYFLSVATTKSISRTASELFVSPPAVSKQISLMEQELDLKLFTRGTQGMELTPEGEIIFSHYLNEKIAFERALQRARNVASHRSRPLHLGVMRGWAIQEQILQLQEMLQELPCPVELIPHSLSHPAQPDRLERGELDAALCIGSELYSAALGIELHIAPIAKIKKQLLFSSRLPVASKLNPLPADLAALPCLTYCPDPKMNVEYDNMCLCNALGFHPQIVLKNSHEDVMFDVGMGKGFMIGDEWMERVLLPGYSSIPVSDTHTVCLVWPAHRKSPDLLALEDCCANKINWAS